MTVSSSSPSCRRPPAPPPKGNGLSVHLVGGLVVLMLMIGSVSFYVIWYQARPLLGDLFRQSQLQLGQNITLALGQQLRLIEGVAKSMSTVVVHLPREERVVKDTIAPLLDQPGIKTVIAGGGIWPEPYTFHPDKERSSFFWGRDPNGKLKFYNDYNLDSGPGYHHEEWYVPARLLVHESVYWSKSYTDPYSLQPMVTCTAPIIKNGKFMGVATIDLMLESVSKILEQLVTRTDAYAFVVDRNNKLITFPNVDMVLTYRESDSKPSPDYVYVSELANKYPLFLPIAAELERLEYHQFLSGQEGQVNPWQYVQKLDLASFRIDKNEARRIASHLWSLEFEPLSYPQEVARFDIDDDIFLKSESSVIVFQMPRTNWKVVTVFKRDSGNEVGDLISFRLIVYIGLALLIFGVIAYFSLKNSILKRLKRMTGQLQNAVEGDTESVAPLDYADSDELGVLVYWFNRRSAQVEAARHQAEQANRVKTEFLAKMSHELRTPLNSIIGFSQRLIKSLGPDLEPRSWEALQAIHRGALLQLELINDILDHSAIESGLVELHLSHESISEIVDNVYAQTRELASAKGLQFLLERNGVDKKLHCDKLKLQQVLMGLVSNAIKATDSGCIKLTVEESVLNGRNAITLVVSDTGVGISEADRAKIFKPFNQFDTNTTQETGLGLYLARYYTDLHGGQLTVESEVGQGASFSVTLPVSGPPE